MREAMIRTVLAAHDGSAVADVVLPAAALMARLFSAPVVVVRVLETMRPFYDPVRGEVVWLSADEPRLELPAEVLLAEQRDALARSGVTPQTVVRLGSAVEELVAEVQRWPDPLLVLASHGRGGLGRAVLGSVADRVVRAGACPVLVVRAGGASLERLTHLLVPLDGSPAAERALPYAVTLAQKAGACLTLVRVAETHRELLVEFRGRRLAPEVTERMAGLEREASAYLDSVRARLPRDVVARTLLVSGDPRRQLVTLVERERPDLVVLTTHGHGAVQRWLIGSVTERLLTTTRVPLLVVPASRELVSP
ncbi:universal stress protein [Thermomicrobium sp. 4228-Ro]|uniref:universal stress protein n=1 Tax=Thermomicrobium sp. 4228-Ro TaxID=2993937 RepID=UPI002248A0D0|nr:universal stress protein [Thermomicrobium sp. 4228-Ro]MCX2728447.1 universal stress protein [Thermomicrobium sp. 4228-Ro]